ADRAKDKADAKADKVANKSQDRADRAGNDISDAWITTKLKSKYYVDDDVKGLNIDVTTNGGVVTLTGKVSNAAERAKALSLAKTTDGVKQVVDKLTIGR
nr:BON domain-containing protein [Acidobacteriota bacterium]